ncbi:UDP-glucosyltransferase 2-like [Ostrinia nubilalis]|uniref:UDP-glucosyltransferase 2-like n=1 Tax=Ostrinia nubilalis TaxID=29057 RepID=UPI00308222C5
MGVLKFSGLFILLYLCSAANAASILVLISSLSYSDHLVYRAYVSQLAQKGHSVVLMTAYPGHFQYPDVERIVELDVSQESGQYWDDHKDLMTNVNDYLPRIRAINELKLKIAIAQLRSKQMTALLINPNIKFDLVVTEADVPLLYAVAEKYKAPHIAFTTSSGKLHQYEAKGNPIHPAYYLDVNSLNSGQMSNWEKLVEFYRHIQTYNDYYYNFQPLCEIAAKKIFDMKRSLLEVEQDIDMLFVANNPVLLGNRPTVPAIRYVDRLHLRPGLHLPQNLQTFLDSATKGIVYFSLGALQEPEMLAPAILNTLADAFRELPYTILWKIANTTMINKSDNVLAQQWFPQQEILAHPNVKAFITSGGSRSLEEAVFYEVPIIGFPLQKPTKTFIEQITKFGAGELLDPYNLEKETVKSTIEAVVTNEPYKISMSKLRRAAFDPAISGPETATWWTEYVLSNKGARHLRSSAVGSSFTKYFMLDIALSLGAVILVFIFLAFLILRYIVRRLLSRFFGKRFDESGKFKAL